MKLSNYLRAVLAAFFAALPLRSFAQESYAVPGADPAAVYTPEQYQERYGNPAVNSFMDGVVGTANPVNDCPAEDTYCADGTCGACSQCCRAHDVWGGAELFLWWAKGSSAPPLVTTSPDGTAIGDVGRLDGPGVQVIAGNELLGQSVQTGGRITAGIWLDPMHDVGLGGKIYGLEGDNSDRTFGPSDGTGGAANPILARPFFNALLNTPDAFLIAFPGFATGSVNVNYVSDMVAAESYLRIMLERNRNRRVDLIAGYQFLRFDDRTLITSNSTTANVFTFDVFDRFATENEFHGGQLGLQGEMLRGAWSLNGLAKIAFGSSRQEVEIAGGTTVNGAPLNGGLLALPTNSGTFTRNWGVVIPEVNVNLVYHRTSNLSFSFGYNLIWLSSVVTSAEQIDIQVNPTQIAGNLVGPARPQFVFNDNDFWFQGMNFGMQWDF